MTEWKRASALVHTMHVKLRRCSTQDVYTYAVRHLLMTAASTNTPNI